MSEQAELTDADRALRRVLGTAGVPDLLEALGDMLPGSDLTVLLLEVFRRRASRLSPADVLRRYQADRFTAPSAGASFAELRRAQDALFAALVPDWDVLALAPVVPLGTHSAVSTVDPRNVIATIRGTEVAADPTNGLALEAAVRRRELLSVDRRSAGAVRLAAFQRVTRAQLFSGPVSFAHFELLGLVTAGRDTGDLRFERAHLAEHLSVAVRGLLALGAGHCRIALTCFDDQFRSIADEITARFTGMTGAQVVDAPERKSGRGYYRGMCFKVFAGSSAEGAELLEVGDGGFTDWTAQYLSNRKERLLISGYGMDRMAICASPSGEPGG